MCQIVLRAGQICALLPSFFLGMDAKAERLWHIQEMPYCDACGQSHKANNKALCEKYQGKQINSARVIRATATMAKAPSRDSSPDLCTQFSTLTLEERELKARKEIEALEHIYIYIDV